MIKMIVVVLNIDCMIINDKNCCSSIEYSLYDYK